MSAVVRATAAGSALPLESCVTVAVTSSVSGGLSRSAEGMNSEMVAATCTRLPMAAAAGGALEVKTKMPSEVFGSASYSVIGVSRA